MANEAYRNLVSDAIVSFDIMTNFVVASIVIRSVIVGGFFNL